MDIIAVQEAKKVKRLVGDTSSLSTQAKDNTVAAINELAGTVNSITADSPVVIEYEIPNVDTNEVRTFIMPFTGSCFIRGIKCTGDAFTGDFYLKIFTKPVSDGGTYVYYSGKVTNILWDIMDIPFMDESGERTIQVMLDNRGALSNFTLQLYVTKG